MESAELERTTVDITAKAGARTIDLRATGTVVKFDGFLTLYTEDQDDEADDEDADRLPEMAAGESAAEARDRRRPSISPSRRRAIRKPRWSSAWRSSASAGPRPTPRSCRCSGTAAMCGSTRSASCPRTRAACSPRSWRTSSPATSNTTSPPISKSSSTRISNNELAWQGRAARLLARLHRRGRRHQGPAHRPGDRRARRDAGAAPVPAEQGRHRSAQVPELRDRPARAEARPVRRLHRLLQLSGMPLHPPARGRARRQPAAACASSARIRTPASKSPCAAAASAAMCSSAKPTKDEDGKAVKPKRASLPKGVSPDEIDLDRAVEAAVAAARSRQAPRRRRADHRRRRPLRPLREARQDLRQYRRRRRHPHHRAEPRRDADRGEEAKSRQGPPLRRRPRPSSSASIRRRAA